MTTIHIVELPVESLDRLRPLWESLKEHHLARFRQPSFRADMAGKSWDERKRELIRPDKALKIVAAQTDGRLIGYCIATIGDDCRGEIDSLYVAADFRGLAVGTRLVETVLGWFEAAGIRAIAISVAYGNEEALRFYEKFGFQPRSYCLQRVGG